MLRPSFAFFSLFAFQLFASSDIPVKYLSNYDGDTIVFTLTELKRKDRAQKYEIFWKNISLRVGGIDTPEIKGECKNEKKLAEDAKYFVKNILQSARKVTIQIVDRDKYFRILGEVFVDEVPLSQLLLDEKLAVPYDGGTKTNPWCKKTKRKRR